MTLIFEVLFISNLNFANLKSISCLHMHKITIPVNMFQNLLQQLSLMSGISHEVIKFWRFSSICGEF